LQRLSAPSRRARSRGLPLPDYVIVSRSGPDHRPLFEVRVSIAGYPPSTASGTSKRAAERDAASLLLKSLQADQSMPP